MAKGTGLSFCDTKFFQFPITEVMKLFAIYVCQNEKPSKDRFLSRDMKIAAEMIRDGSIWNCVREHVSAYED